MNVVEKKDLMSRRSCKLKVLERANVARSVRLDKSGAARGDRDETGD